MLPLRCRLLLRTVSYIGNVVKLKASVRTPLCCIAGVAGGAEVSPCLPCHEGPPSLHGTRASLVNTSMPVLLLPAGGAHGAEAAYSA